MSSTKSYVGSVVKVFQSLSLLFSDPELGQVQPDSGGGGDVMLILGIMVCIYIAFIVVSSIVDKIIQNKRRRRG